MNTMQISMILLMIVILSISFWWISQTIKEGKKALDEMRK